MPRNPHAYINNAVTAAFTSATALLPYTTGLAQHPRRVLQCTTASLKRAIPANKSLGISCRLPVVEGNKGDHLPFIEGE